MNAALIGPKGQGAVKGDLIKILAKARSARKGIKAAVKGEPEAI